MPFTPTHTLSYVSLALTSEKQRIRISAIFLLIYCIIAMHYFDLPTVPLSNQADIKIEVFFFFILLAGALLTFLAYQLPITKELFLIALLPSIAFIWTIYGIIVLKNSTFRALFELQPFLFYLSALFPLIFMRNAEDGKFIIKWLTLLTIVFIPFLYLQHLLFAYNITIIPGKIEVGFMSKNFVRFIPKANQIIQLVYFYVFWKFLRKPNIFNTAIFTIFLIILIIPLYRNVWISIIIGSMVITWIEKKEMLKKLPLMLLFILLGVSAFILILSETALGQLLFKRLEMLSISAIQTDNSLVWRSYESRMAIKSILDAPFIGHGLGYSYHNTSQFANSIHYIHNNYLFLWMKMGIVGLIAFIFFLVNMLKTSMHIYKTYSEDHIISGAAISTLAYITGIIPSLAVAPFLSNNMSTIILVSVIYGIFLKLKQLNNIKETV
jgi:O-antigen ligase